MIFVDSNIPMYLVGTDDQLKHDTQVKVERAIASGEELVTSAEVLQEICHRYAAINRREAIQPAFDALLRIVDEVIPVEREDVEAARDEILRHPTRSARDALHIEMIRRYRIQRVMSFDKGFDRLPGIERI